MDLDADIRAEMLKYLPVPDRETASMLADMPTGRLLDCFLKWRDRLVHPHPRALRIAADLQANPRFAALEQDVRMIWQSAVHGENLAPYLGRGARFARCARSAVDRFSVRDILSFPSPRSSQSVRPRESGA